MRKIGVSLKACRRCKMLIPPKIEICPNCGSRDFSTDWIGMIIILDVENSVLAEKLDINKPGRYAIKVR
ncbi:MAG: DNA-binding protein [Thermofilum sp. ex4484_82]|nr:DNA-directed RNA polymerase, subunit E'' [Thermoproteales archaeon]OYT29287.1 MAG: DNA-binding protein [Thermofilum sp. ex4484_82]OYT39196.1 MAG: DNA-binding protein [Archaeoglobales archaeon ex4484_92]RLE75111.1 MAG: DNA-binding protein [Thermoprotei archaeon]RLE76377.1 MAG: DNA-binding protein [Thermoprotei archaeon]